MKDKISVSTSHESNLKTDVLRSQFVQLNLVCFILCYTEEIHQIPVVFHPVLMSLCHIEDPHTLFRCAL